MSELTLFLCGDVMTGRGIDQILQCPVEPRLYEPYAHSALDYVDIAEGASGPIPRRVAEDYIWGDALAELARRAPHACIGNLETAVTTSEDAWPGKGIHYRMHPANVRCLTAFGLDCCVLANNHVLDWGREGLAETLRTLHEAGLRTAGAGVDGEAASAPAMVESGRGGRVLVYGRATTSSGVPGKWSATERRSGVALLPDLSARSIGTLADRIAHDRREGDCVVLSIHWGENWGYEVSRSERAFAHALIDEARVDVVHGHSSHHAKAVELYRGKPVLYGCGDFLNDYEGIGGHERYRPDLALMYFAAFRNGTLARLEAVPMRVQRFRLSRAGMDDAREAHGILQRECAKLDTAVELADDGTLAFTA